MVIRQAGIEDAAEIHRLLLDLAAALGKTADIKSSVQDIRRFGFESEPHFEALLAFENGQAVGLAVYFYEFSSWRGVPGVYLQDLYVADEMRGRGLGRDLMDAVRERGRAWGGAYVRLTLHDGNERALAFYRRLGFEAREDELPLVLRD
ncbi:MAG: GNAT family N-acetyltransferase [Xanthomonadales bacterium]|nr:GNAT family N-acetyltransferase [Xanthomonadales bacterium]